MRKVFLFMDTIVNKVDAKGRVHCRLTIALWLKSLIPK